MRLIGFAGLIILVFLFGCATTPPVSCINVTCNGVTSCRAPNNIPPCVPPIPTPANNTSVNGTEPPATCPDGYVCGIASDGCAVPGAVYNCPNEPVPPINASGSKEVNLAQELNNSAGAGFSLDEGMFHANSSSDCAKELISQCDNNVPSQFVCVNQRYAANVSSQYGAIYSKPGMCPEFLLAGNVSCGLDDGSCVVLYQGPD